MKNIIERVIKIDMIIADIALSDDMILSLNSTAKTNAPISKITGIVTFISALLSSLSSLLINSKIL